MKVRQLGFTVAGIAALVIAFLVGRHFRVAKTTQPDRLVTISALPSPQPGCEVDYPVASLRQNINQIQWATTGKPYWVSFKPLEANPPHYVEDSPLVPKQDIVPVPDPNSSGNLSRKFNVLFKGDHGDPHCTTNCPDYYMYAIYDHDPNDPTTDIKNPCKKATDEHDTGVIVKR